MSSARFLSGVFGAIGAVLGWAIRAVQALVRWLRSKRGHAIAFLAVFALGFLGMGLLGLLVFYFAAPVLWPLFGDPNQWSGDWVWPAMIGAGMLWSFGFLMAGSLQMRLRARGRARWLQWSAWAAVLWVWALVSSLLAMGEDGIRAQRQAMTAQAALHAAQAQPAST